MPTDDRMEVSFMPLPIQLACPVPVTADGRTVDADGQPILLADRPERCAVWAHWMIGGQVSCDVHTMQACELLGIDFDGLVIEAGRDPSVAREPWDLRDRSTQEDAQRTQDVTRRVAGGDA